MKCFLVLIAILGGTTSTLAKEIEVINIICTSKCNNINYYLQNDTSFVSGVYNATSKILSLHFSVGLASAEISISDENGILFSNVYSIHPKDIKTIDLSSYNSDKYIIHIKSEADEEFEGFLNNDFKTITNNIREDVLSHYKTLGDTIRYNAALFLLNNIEFHSYKHSAVLGRYYDKIEEINNKYKYPECITQYNKLYVELGMPDSLQVLYDSNELDADFIIENVDVAVNDWLNGTWAKHLSFDEFCEYILPYRVGDEPPTYNWRKDLRKRYLWRAEGIKVSDDQRYSAYWATCAINDAIIRQGCHIHSIFPHYDLEMPLKTLKNMHLGECHDYARYATYALRACGIPVAIDYTPQWPDRALNHYWNVLFDNSGKPLTFLGGDTNPGTINKPGQKLAKVYRRTFAYQHQSLFALNRNYNERIPNTLCSPFIKDVSNDYFVGRTIKVKLNDAHIFDKFAYIAVFNNQEWIPVDYSCISEDRHAVFNNLGRDIVYLPVFWGRNGSVPAGNPILLPYLGEPKELIPDKRKMQDIVIGRKFPLFKRIVNFRRAMKNGWFEAANKDDFSDAVKCAEIKGVPSIGLDTLIVSNKKTFRYWRYVSPKSKRCEVAELAFITQKTAPNDVRYISSPSSSTDNNVEKAFDGDRLTYFESDSNTNSWVGVDFGTPVIIDKIAYIPRNDDNSVVPGERYELSFFENGRQKSAGIQTAKDNYLKFSSVPSNCLYILHNLDKGTEERIFIYENGIIKWY